MTSIGKRVLLCSSIVCLFLAMSLPARASERLIINIGRQEGTLVAKVYGCVYTRIFDRLGHTVEFKYRPSKRSLSEVNYGVADVEGGRIQSLDHHPRFKNLLRISEPVYADSISIFASKDISLKGEGWSVLEDMYEKHHITPMAIRGILAVKNNLSKRAYSRMFIANDVRHALKNLSYRDNGRDVIVHPASAMKDALHGLNMSYVKNIFKVQDHILYPVLNKKWAHLEGPMTKELKALKASGDYDILLQKVNSGQACM